MRKIIFIALHCKPITLGATVSPPGVEKGQTHPGSREDEEDSLTASYSWLLLSDRVARKKMDKSSFLHHEMAIPVGIRPFFCIDDMQVGEKRPVSLVSGVIEYPAYFEMLNAEHPRTRLVWKSDLQRLIHATFPAWAAHFRGAVKPHGSPPDLKIKKTPSSSKFLVFFEEIQRASDSLDLLRVYSREDLKQEFNVTDTLIRQGVFRLPGISSVWLFVTGEKLPDGTGFRHHFDGQVLCFEGPSKNKTDGLVIGHVREGDEIVVFYRKKRRDPGFRYVGRFSYSSYTPGQFVGDAARFILYPLDVMPDGKGNLIAAGKNQGPEGLRIDAIEQDPRVRLRAIEAHGTTCAVCGFNFSEKYGTFGEGYIEIHCSCVLCGDEMDPDTDCVPVCANCHRMIHRGDPPLGVEEMKKMLR